MGGLSEKSSFTFYRVVTRAGEENSRGLLGGIINWWLHEGPDSHITYLQAAFFPQCSPTQLWFSVCWKTDMLNLSTCASVWPQVTPDSFSASWLAYICGNCWSGEFWGILMLANKPDQTSLLHPIEIISDFASNVWHLCRVVYSLESVWCI